jgi:hypothetical protein
MKIAKQGIFTVLALLLIMASFKDSQAQNQVAKWLNATWEGTGFQTDRQSWTMRLTVNGDKYLIEYPSLRCGGEWILVQGDPNKARFREKITYGLGIYINNGDILIERINDSQIKYSYTPPNSKSVLASAKLLKSRNGNSEGPRQAQANVANDNQSQRQTITNPPNREETYAQESRDPIHKSGTKLLETQSYAVYKKRPYYSNFRRSIGEFCGPYYADRSKNEVRISIVHKVNADYVITDDKEYRRRFEAEIFPIVGEQCKNIQVVFIDNYIYNVRINYDGEEYTYGQQVPRGFDEHPLNMIYVYTEPNGFRYEVLALNNSSSRTYSSLASLRSIRDKEVIAVRKQEELERRRIAEIESKGGIEPTSDDLAIASARFLTYGNPTCPNLENKEWCEWSINVWIRLKGGKKLSCKPEVVGQDYHCEYTLDFECMVRGPKNEPINHPACLTWTVMSATPAKTGVRRAANGWSIYPLQK